MCRVRPEGMLLDTPQNSLSSCPLRHRHLWLSVARVRLSFATTSLLITCTVLRNHGPFWTISRTITALLVKWGTLSSLPRPSPLLLPGVHHPEFNRTSLRPKVIVQTITSLNLYFPPPDTIIDILGVPFLDSPLPRIVFESILQSCRLIRETLLRWFVCKSSGRHPGAK